jgi:hypothetical protein
MSNNIDTTLYGTNSSNITPIRNKNWKGYSYSTNGRCGPTFNNTACPDNQCCSTSGWCGITNAHCAQVGTPAASLAGSMSDGIYNDYKPSYNTSSDLYDGNLEDRLYFTLLHKNINNCNPLTSTNMTNCNNYYNNASNNINKRYAGEYNNANSYIYSNPTDPILTSFEADNDNLCAPEYGKNRKQLYTANYTFPIINVHSDYIKNNYTTNNIQSIKNLSLNQSVTLTTINGAETVTFTRINDNYPERYQLNKNRNCSDRPYRTQTDVNNRWTAITGCDQPLTATMLSNNVLNSSYDTLQYLVNQSDVDAVFNPYKLNNMLANTTNDYNKRKTCYGNENYVVITNSNKNLYTPGNRLGPGFRFVRGVTDGVVILRSGNYTFSILETGNLYIYGPGGHIHGVYLLNNLQSLTMQHDGNLVIIDTTGAGAYYSNTYDNPGAYLELEDTGELYIKNSTGVIKEYVRSRIRNHLTTAFYDNSPVWMFSDKAGRVWKVPFSGFTADLGTSALFQYNSSATNFRGPDASYDNTAWNTVTQRNLVHINGYDTELNNTKPDTNTTNDNNYYSGTDRVNFMNDLKSTAPNNGIRKPIQFGDNYGGMTKTNYIPGYTRISNVTADSADPGTTSFLVSRTSGTQTNIGYVLYKKIQNKDLFADDIIQNHPKIIEKLKEYYRNN